MKDADIRMDIDIIDRIRLSYNTFSKAKKKVAEYILKDPKPIIYMSITELSEKSEVGEGSIFRFCQDIGCKGYQDFRLEVAKSIYLVEEGPYQEEGLSDRINTIAEKIYKNSINALALTKKLLNSKDIEKAVEWMTNAKKICFFGAGASFVSALEGYNRFARIIPNVFISNDTHVQIATASLLNSDDVVIIISYSGSSKEIVTLAKIAKQRKAKVVCITHFIKSPLSSFADIAILCGTDDRLLQGTSLSADIAQQFLLGIIFSEFCKRNKSLTEGNKKVVAEALLDMQY